MSHDHCCSHEPKKNSQPVAPDSIYTCPMHPEIKQVGPGSCPICGMALEPLLSAEDDDTEYKDMLFRLWVSSILSAFVLFLAMGDMFFNFSLFLTPTANRLLQLVLTTPVVLWAGWPFFVRGWNSILNKSLNMFSLIALGIGVAFIYSVIATLFPQLFPDSIKQHGEVPIYFETSAIITALVLLGQVLELKARSKTSTAIKALLTRNVKSAIVVRSGKELEIPIEQVIVGDLIRVHPGEKIPVDGKITLGSSSIRRSHDKW